MVILRGKISIFESESSDRPYRDKIYIELGGVNISAYGPLDADDQGYLESESGIALSPSVWLEINMVIEALFKGNAKLKEILSTVPRKELSREAAHV